MGEMFGTIHYDILLYLLGRFYCNYVSKNKLHPRASYVHMKKRALNEYYLMPIRDIFQCINDLVINKAPGTQYIVIVFEFYSYC